MRNRIFGIVGTALLAASLAVGCGGSGTSNQVFTPTSDSGAAVSASATTPTSPAAALTLEQAMLNDPDTSTQLAPSKHLNPLGKAAAAGPNGVTIIPVATLESNYETLFCQLSTQFNVTLQTPQSVDKINFIKSQEETGHFDLLAKPILNNPVGVTAVSFQPVTYQTTVPLPTGNQTFQVSGGLLMPLGIDKSRLKGVVTYFHGTTFNKSQVGSNYATNTETQLLAQVFASQGYIVVVPDYVGQGVDWADVHPYVLYPTVSAKTAVDMLAAVKPLIVAQYGFDHPDAPMKLFSAGYSEGGSYSLWFNTFIASTPGVLDPFYRLTHSVGMEGAYNTSAITFDYLFGNVGPGNGNPLHVQTQALVNLVKPLLSADAFLSYATYSEASDYLAVVSQPFFNLDCDLLIPQSFCDVGGQQMNIAQAFAQPDTTVSMPLLFGAFGKRANGAVYPGPLEFVTSSANSVKSLVSSTLLTAGPLQQLMQVLEAADANLTPAANSGVTIITLAEDSVVVSNNFDNLLAKYPTKIKRAIKIDENNLLILSPFSPALKRAVFVPTDHLHGLIYEYLYALHTFNTN